MSAANPLVESTFLAVAACHLRYVSPGVLQHRIAEHFQQSLLLSHLQKLLNTPSDQFLQSDADAAILCATLLNVITFVLPDSHTATDTDPTSSWVFSMYENCLGWLDLQVGLRPLLLSMAPYFVNTMNFLGPIFLGAEKQTWEFKKMPQAVELIPKTWIDFFELKDFTVGCDSKSNEIGEIFRAPVIILAQLRSLESRSLSNVYKCFQFLAKVQKEFRALLREKDDRVLWLFGYWLGILCRFDGIWWCEKRAKRDYTAICMWLRQRDLGKRSGIEGRRWTAMVVELESVWSWKDF
jgi:hypothetical protein